ncbi:transcription elongation regulator 1-like protein isoform X2 [Acanthochromis polyacanthus]|uniref:transcription elongation regulator 1-like protein isoform X2 n=1 Tax=Acanthochromis polyacanthus TaxID=80966 RepID=UPI002234558F|nr:transcription elongation regulator 1-like protein isoform X2 [Acanthochromis polyacanthus]
MMLPVSRVKGQPIGMVTSTTPWLSISSDPAPQWLWMASWSTATYQATPPPVFYPPAVWVPEHTHLIQWEHPAVEIVPLVPPFYQSSHFHLHHPQPKLSDGWISPEEVGVFLRRDKPLLLTNQMIPRPGGQTSRSRLLLCPSRRSDRIRRHAMKPRDPEPEDSSSSSILSVSPVHLPVLTAPPPTGGAYCEWAGLHTQRHEEAWPISVPNQQQRQVWMKPTNSHNRRLSPPVKVIKEVQPSFLSAQFSSRFTLVADCRHNKRGMGGRNVSYGGTLLLRTERKSDDNKQCVSVSVHRDEEDEEEGSEERRNDKRPVASTPVPGSPWCVVWTGDDRVFFFNPTIHLSVWERPGDLIGRDISHIIEDPPHKRRKLTPVDSSCQSSGLHGDDDDDDDDHKHTSKRNRIEESMSLVPHPGEVKLLPLELRIAHFREMLLERGVSAFSTWEKELHKMVFDPRYLLLTSDQRKQVFDQFVKSRVKDEYKEKRSKLQKAREEFRQLLEEAKITSRSTFKDFCARCCGDQRFNALNRKKEQELLFNHYITSLKKRDNENRTRLRKMR